MSFLSLVLLVAGTLPGGQPGLFAIEKVRVGAGADARVGMTVVIRAGRIAAIGADVAIPPQAERIDGTGLTLLPGFIDGWSDFGMGSEAAPTAPAGPPGTRGPGPRGDRGERAPTAQGVNDGVAQDESSDVYPETAEASRRGLRPEVRARELLAAQDHDADEKLRGAGFTDVITAPADGFFAGQACLVQLSELPSRDAVMNEPGILFAKLRGGGRDGGYPTTLMGALAHLRQAFQDARRLASWRDTYRHAPANVPRPPSDSCLDTLLRALNGELRVAFAVDREGDILRALALAEEFRLKPMIVGGKEAWKVAGRLAAAHVPVIASLAFADAPERKNAKLKKKEAPKPGEKAPPETSAVTSTAAANAPSAAKSDEAPSTAPSTENPKPAATAAAPQAAADVKPADEWDVADPVLAEPLELFLERQHDWEDEVRNVERLLATGVEVALTTRGSSGISDFLGDLRVAIEKGLDANAALLCLTRTPAALFGVEQELGSVRVGATADVILVDGDLAAKERSVRHVFVAGRHFAAPKKKADDKKDEKKRGGKEGAKSDVAAALDLSGTWTITGSGGGRGGFKSTLTLKQEGTALTGKLEGEMGTADVTSGSLDGDQFKIVVTAEFQKQKFEFVLKGTASKDELKGTLETPFGQPMEFDGKRGPSRDDTEDDR